MSHRGIDDMIRDYYGLFGMAQDIVDSTGRVYGSNCLGCDGRIRHWKEAGELWVCGHCGERWPYLDVDVMKGEVGRRSSGGKPKPAPRPGEYEERLLRNVDLGYALNAMLRSSRWRYPAQVLVGYALTSCSYGEIAEHAEFYRWPTRRGGCWTESMARGWAHLARIELSKRTFGGKRKER